MRKNRTIAIKKLICFLALLAGIPFMNAKGFSEKELTVTAPDGCRMGATLAVPESGKPKAAIVLVSGSGTQNRDEEIMGKKPFKTISDFFSDAGYAVLRVDDRGFDKPELAARKRMQTDIEDADAAIALADSIFPGIPVGAIGHSSGGECVIVSAANNPALDFIITLAAPACSGDSLVMSQSRALAVALTGAWEAEPLQRRLLDIAKSDLPDMTARIFLTQAFNESIGEAASLPQVQETVQQRIAPLLSPWYRSMLRLDPSDAISMVNKPWLALNGSKDLQVLPFNLQIINELNPKAVTKLIEGHNHLFQPCTSGMPDEYEKLPGDISQETLEVILSWLKEKI